MKKTVALILTFLFLACGENPLGDSNTDSSISPDTEAPTAPTSLNFTGNATLINSPSLSWTASTDNKAVTSYEISLGTASGLSDVVAFFDIGFVTTHQFLSLIPSLTIASQYFINIRAIDAAGNKSSLSTLSFYSQGLSLNSGAYQFPEAAFAKNCLEYINSPRYNAEGNGLYWIDPDGSGGDAEIKAFCDMTRDSGGWTLIANRRIQGSNVETCQSDLNSFFQNTCGNPANISSSDSYSIGNTARRENIISNGEWLFTQYDVTDTEDTDDTFIIHHDNTDLFFSSTGILNRTGVSKVCDFNNTNCDSIGVEFLWTGDGYFSSAACTAPYSAPGGTYYGNYAYCHNGAAGNANSLFGNRDAYNETKLWGHPSGGGSYYERIFTR